MSNQTEFVIHDLESLLETAKILEERKALEGITIDEEDEIDEEKTEKWARKNLR